MNRPRGRLASLLQQRSYTLLVLEGCRYDAFDYELDGSTIQTDSGPLRGDLTRASSLATHPYVWLARAFTDWYHDVQVYADNPLFNREGTTPHAATVEQNTAVCADALGRRWRATDHFPAENIHESWRRTEIARHHRCTASRVVDHVQSEGFGEKNILWFMEPLPPYTEAGGNTEYEYQQTLRKTLNAIATVADDAPGDVVITSTHGTSFAPPDAYHLDYDREYTYYAPGIATPELRDVPWFVLK